jgi:hypothetical protein
MIELSGWQIAAAIAVWTSLSAYAEIGDLPRAPAPSGHLVEHSRDALAMSDKAPESSASSASSVRLPTAELAVVRRELAAFDKAWAARLPEGDPRFGIIRVLSLLNLDHPGLEKVKAAAAENRYPDAKRELLIHFRNSRIAGDAAPRKLDETLRLHADDALQHRFRGNKDVFPPVYRGARIDWTGRAFSEGKEIHDGEWYFQFQRLTWWPALAAAYATIGNEDYFREWRYEMVRWADDLLPFTAETPDFVKRGMETYGRCERMIEVLPRMIRSRDFDAKTLLYFLASFHDQADHIPRVYAKTGCRRPSGRNCSKWAGFMPCKAFRISPSASSAMHGSTAIRARCSGRISHRSPRTSRISTTWRPAENRARRQQKRMPPIRRAASISSAPTGPATRFSWRPNVVPRRIGTTSRTTALSRYTPTVAI